MITSRTVTALRERLGLVSAARSGGEGPFSGINASDARDWMAHPRALHVSTAAKQRSLMVGVAAICLIALPGLMTAGGVFLASPAAMAATSVSFSVGTFYDSLASDGDWVAYHGAHVFTPSHVPDGWRPYTVGHWAHTKQFGWMWVSSESFGWATYHYGRWGYGDDIGWYWVPGTRWAPAWVSWRRGDGYAVWAPLPPRRGDVDMVTIEVTYEDTPDYYWVALPTSDFLSPDLSIVIIRDDRERRRIVDHSAASEQVRVENNIVINNFISIDVVEQATNKKVKTLAVKDAATPEQGGKQEGDVAVVFKGDATSAPDAKPAIVKPIEAVKEVQSGRKDKPVDTAAPPADAMPPPKTDAGAPAEPAVVDPPKAVDAPKTDAPKTDAPKTDAPKAVDAPKVDTRKKDAPVIEPPAKAVDKPVVKPKADAPALPDPQPPKHEAKPPTGEPEPAQPDAKSETPKPKDAAPAMNDAPAQPTQDGQGQKRKKRPVPGCDPATDANC